MQQGEHCFRPDGESRKKTKANCQNKNSWTVESEWSIHIIWDFPYGFWPTTSVDLFCDFLPAPRICKDFFPIRPGYSLEQGGFVDCMLISSAWEVNLGNMG